NILRGCVESADENAVLLVNTCGSMLAQNDGMPAKQGSELTLAVRGENIAISREPENSACLRGIVEANTFAGGMLRIPVKLCDGTEVIVTRQGIHFDFTAGDTVYLSWNADDAVLVDREEVRA
ncbi:MAG: TOBE domain-containing protein, partial [Oscillospiraceae bacterium]|nr:TOBE domain-containing protein [Oscillospiraceae bacterium]